MGSYDFHPLNLTFKLLSCYLGWSDSWNSFSLRRSLSTLFFLGGFLLRCLYCLLHGAFLFHHNCFLKSLRKRVNAPYSFFLGFRLGLIIRQRFSACVPSASHQRGHLIHSRCGFCGFCSWCRRGLYVHLEQRSECRNFGFYLGRSCRGP